MSSMTIPRLWCFYRHLYVRHTSKLCSSSTLRFQRIFSTSNMPLHDRQPGSRIFRKFKKNPLSSTEDRLPSIEAVEESIQKGQLIQGQLRTNSRTSGFIEHPLDGTRIFIEEFPASKYRHGDFVAVKINPIKLWKVRGTSHSEKVDGVDQDLPPDNGILDTVEPIALDPALDSINLGDIDEPAVTASQSTSSIGETLKPLTFGQALNYRDFLTVENLHNSPNKSGVDPNLLSSLKDIDCNQSPSALTTLPHPDLIRTGSLVTVLKRNQENQRLLGKVAFFPFSKKHISRFTDPIKDSTSMERCVCMFIPYSLNFNLVKLDPLSIPKEIWTDWKLGLEKTFVCQVTGWNSRTNTPSGVLCEQLGDVNDLTSGTKRILTEFGIRDTNFLSSHLDGLPSQPEQFRIPDIEYRRRKDFRSCCVFTIDPASAKDFDDALHVKRLDSGLYEVGIHIADVSYFVRPQSALDNEASERTTSVYLVQKVIPMLPSILSEHICSLVPSEDRLAFSVVLTVKESGEIVNEWFGRSLIRSRARLTYDHAWSIIQAVESGADSHALDELYKMLPKPEQPFTMKHVQNSIMLLHTIAQNIRKTRIKNGALTMQKVELQFDLPLITSNTGSPQDSQGNNKSDLKLSPIDSTIWPRGFSVKTGNPSHELIEEWMIAANRAVARQLFSHFVKLRLSPRSGQPTQNRFINYSKIRWIGGLLRRHPQPDRTKLNNLAEIAKAADICLDVSSSGALANSMAKVTEDLQAQGCGPTLLASITTALSYLTYVRLPLAVYFSLDDSVRLLESSPQTISCLKDVPGDLNHLRSVNNKPSLDAVPQTIFDYTWHYGLSIPLYTHFTSPIRRYADLLVHRELASLLGCADWTYSARVESPSKDNQITRLLQKFAKGFQKNPNTMMIEQTKNPSLLRLSLQAAWCNDRRIKARRAGEASQRLFLTACIRDCGPLIEDAIILDIGRNHIKILVTAFGVVLEVRMNQFLCKAARWEVSDKLGSSNQDSHLRSLSSSKSNGSGSILRIFWDDESDEAAQTENPDTITHLHMFSVIPCQLHCPPNKLTILAELVRSTNTNTVTTGTITDTTDSVHKTV